MPEKRKKSSNIPVNQPRAFWNGTLCDNDNFSIPKCIRQSKKLARPGHNNKCDASEYADGKQTLSLKMKKVAELIEKSNNCVLYCGAGISQSSGIPDYASRANGSIVKSSGPFDPIQAKPTYAHRVVGRLMKLGKIKHVVTQNHDALFMKAGCPQKNVTEIHGSIFDPSGPVVQFWESLREDNLQNVVQCAQNADLVIVVGTSLSGMTSDMTCTDVIKRHKRGEPGCMGCVLLNLQKTPVDADGSFAVRCWGKIDESFKLLVKHMGLGKIGPPKKIKRHGSKIIVPYDENGKFDASKKMILDFSTGAKVKICDPRSSAYKNKGVATHPIEGGHYGFQFRLGSRRLGVWWIREIKKGNFTYLPIMNVYPKFESAKPKSKKKG